MTYYREHLPEKLFKFESSDSKLLEILAYLSSQIHVKNQEVSFEPNTLTTQIS